MLDAGCSMLDTRCRMLDAGCSMLDAGCSMLDTRCWMLDAGYSILDERQRSDHADLQLSSIQHRVSSIDFGIGQSPSKNHVYRLFTHLDNSKFALIIYQIIQVRGFAPIGMMEYWKNGFCNTAMACKLSAEGGTTIKLTMDHILLKPTIPWPRPILRSVRFN